MPYTPLLQDFYLQPTLHAAESLIGQLLVRTLAPGTVLVGRIVETEAYVTGDPASHAFRGPTLRNQAMFGPRGRAYVYLIYGMHYCLNAVTGPEGAGEAVLIRALEPLAGIEIMRERRNCPREQDLTAGPARLCQAFDIDTHLTGADLSEGPDLIIAKGPGPAQTVEKRARIGISHPEASAWLWRFIDPQSRFLSRR